MAKSMGAKYFSMATGEWDALTDAGRWEANKAFIDDAIGKGYRILFSNSPLDDHTGTWFGKEIEYLNKLTRLIHRVY